MKTLTLLLLILSLAGCATTPTPTPGNDPAVYRPTAPITYPIPR